MSIRVAVRGAQCSVRRSPGTAARIRMACGGGVPLDYSLFFNSLTTRPQVIGGGGPYSVAQSTVLSSLRHELTSSQFPIGLATPSMNRGRVLKCQIAYFACENPVFPSKRESGRKYGIFSTKIKRISLAHK